MTASPLAIDTTVRLRSGYELPLLGLGVYMNDDAKTASLAALKAGYRHIDSARMYGNEAQVGEAVRESGIPRNQIYITSKVTNDDHGYEKTLAAVDESLKTFGFDYLDFMLIHSAMSDKPTRLATWKALIEAKKAGKIRSIGVSNYGVKHLEEIREAGLELPDVNQIELQPLNQQKEIAEYCNKHGIFIEAYAPLMRTQWDVPAILEVAKKYTKTPAQILVRWSLQRGFAPLPKSANPARVASNADVYDFELSAEDVARIDALDRGKEGTITWNPVDVD
ncbi:Aldo/keto reductase [Dichomitus squalens LYAD-421 SS1]|uniref:Aldo/keto reductase n=1 Tax=Dichomitus squalens (strain LYAD-421) TaxID=732165 RepID=R7SQV1_DICSQ|nr:Aldo/keto reductase [Dichomitus squalens LYAD-421 SS1]EJF58130.1 Aldo/keto reductase [Dichomitus squalens LYAD-421 SS1]